MTDFVDLKGASGQAYRFRRAPAGAAHVPTAGNFAVLKIEARGFKMLALGMSLDLSTAEAEGRVADPKGVGQLYTRLNIARATRVAEHEDILAQYNPPVVVDPKS